MRDPNALLAKEQDLEIYENQRYGEDPPAANEAILWQQNACTCGFSKMRISLRF